jgi:transposase-like protein
MQNSWMETQIVAPIPGKDYPQNWNDFLDWFGTEEACLAYLEKLRWPAGFVCPSCATIGEAYRASRTRLMCRACQHQCTVTSGTIFDKTRTPLRVWLAAAWYVTNQKQGVSALGLQRVLGLGSYQTAWTMLHRFRRAMIRPGREQLKGVVEVDETYLAISDRQKPISPEGRKNSTTKILMAIAVEILQPKGFGRIRLRRIPKGSQSQLMPFVQEVIEPGAQVHTDGSAAYRSLTELGYHHQRTVMLGSDVPAHVSMAGVHRVAALVQRWILGTHHGSVQPEHLDAYLDEFVFRFNRRTSGSRGMLFYRLLQQAVVTEPVTYAQVASCTKRKKPVQRKAKAEATTTQSKLE